jgi:TetR/AcrR family transcriptional regulator, tetracycline repressor protein
MSEAPARRTGRPPRTSREQILDAAALFRSDELQLTTLAEQIGISVKTVYYYFPNRKALLDALTERAVAELGYPDVAGCRTPREVLTVLARWGYGVALDHPLWYVEAAPSMALGMRVWSIYLDRMNALGVDDATAFAAYQVVGSYAFGAGAAAYRTREMGGLAGGTVERYLGDVSDAAGAARMAELVRDTDLTAWFERGLSVVLAGLAQELLDPASHEVPRRGRRR